MANLGKNIQKYVVFLQKDSFFHSCVTQITKKHFPVHLQYMYC